MVVGVVTLGVASFSLFTLVGGAYWITLGVGAGVSIFFNLQNIYTKKRSDAVCSVSIVLYSSACERFYMVWMRSRSA